LTHRSAAGPNNERLEFLGDAVLNLLVAQHLFRSYPDVDEGDLSRLRARVVSREPLAQIAQSLALGEVLQLGSGELKSGGFRRASILSDALEAICGALFLDGGLAAAQQVFGPLIDARVALLPAPRELKDPKTRLQEHLQAHGHPLPLYVVEQISGEPHAQSFVVLCSVPALGVQGSGGGSNRRRAEQEAAQQVLRALPDAT
ncbi:MAG TPA: ribonuclease III, partial [Steroidobacteraceae bacterium]